MWLNRLRIGNRGDTIIEVLIAVAVMSSVLGIAYSIMNLNIETVRDNQERSEASKVAQAQVELLRSVYESDAIILNPGGSFCLTSGNSRHNNLGNMEDFVNGYSGNCKYSGGVTVSPTGIYHVDIRSNSPESYTVTVRWSKIGGGVNKVVIGYRLR